MYPTFICSRAPLPVLLLFLFALASLCVFSAAVRLGVQPLQGGTRAGGLRAFQAAQRPNAAVPGASRGAEAARHGERRRLQRKREGDWTRGAGLLQVRARGSASVA